MKGLAELVSSTAQSQDHDIQFAVDSRRAPGTAWWIVHRERWKRGAEDLPRALAELQSAIYAVPVEQVLEHGRLRAEAMKIRDTKAENGAAMTEEDWSKITELLRKSWHSLAVAVTTSTNLTPPSNQSNGSH